MPRSAAAYLADVLDACDAIDEVLANVDLPAYKATRSIRSAVEREFITVGEAVNSLSRVAPELYAGISNTRMIIGFRNVLTHDYAGVDDESVFEAARVDLPTLRRECAQLLEQVDGAD